ncbi:hypothetical protein [Methanospirillum lacunae]|uniref:Uncharacterized protein n=1 Tax=Methanospirillum lacunae TaxID=668570 RepID=A0A2V2NB47_9EURY|nr:hypothetical protein [Methanospirillum lacunae]PWR72791.1 hypothetical protein DK846_07520 [Methanospirillum lacunae]
MMQLTDSTRRLLIFITIVLGGSILLIFDIPVLYLMMVVIGLALGLMVATGMLILSELIKELRIKLKNRKPKPKKPKSKVEKNTASKGSGGGLISGLLQKLPKMPSLPSVNLSLPKTGGKTEKKEKPTKKVKKDDSVKEAGDSSDSGESSSGISQKDDDNLGDDLLDGLDLDDSLDIDAELESVNPEFDSVRTPYGDTDVMQELPSEEQVRRMDITTSDEEEDVVIDTDEPSDEVDEIYSSTIEIGSDSGGEIISTMEGGDSISGSDLASYSSSEETPYMYGGDDDSGGGEEQFELSQGKGGLGDDDLIASLKADISDLKKRDDDVLLRDLKDVHVTAEELAEELEDIMKIITKKAKNK